MIKKYSQFINENKKNPIERKDKQETIDEILDNLSKKGKLSKSERKFMDEASNNTISEITTPNSNGNFWDVMSNPHNLSIMWLGKESVWNELKTVENEEDEELDKIEDSNMRWNLKREYQKKKWFEENPDLEKDLNQLLELRKQANKFSAELREKYKSKMKSDHKFNQSLDYSFDKEQTMIELFGYYGENGEQFIGLNPKYKKK